MTLASSFGVCRSRLDRFTITPGDPRKPNAPAVERRSITLRLASADVMLRREKALPSNPSVLVCQRRGGDRYWPGRQQRRQPGPRTQTGAIDCSNHGSRPVKKQVRKSWSQPLLMRPIRCLSPLAVVRGVKPAQTVKGDRCTSGPKRDTMGCHGDPRIWEMWTQQR
jgi:hypothetical protein